MSSPSGQSESEKQPSKPDRSDAIVYLIVFLFLAGGLIWIYQPVLRFLFALFSAV